MGRRRRNPKDPPDSTHWSSYRPNQAKYWFYGGAWIPPEKIPPKASMRPEDVRSHERPVTRMKSVAKMLDEAVDTLATSIEHYRDLHERGAEALEWEWA